MVRFLSLILAAVALNGCVAVALPVVAGSVLATRDVIEEGNARRSKSAIETESADTTGPILPPIANGTATTENVGPTSQVSLPPPSNSQAEVSVTDTYGSFISFALQRAPTNASSDQGFSETLSAVLRNPSALDGERTSCGDKKPVVLIDLDPSDGSADFSKENALNLTLAAGLASLRQADLEIAWISSLSASSAGAVRKALVDTGLDTEGEDTLLLMRYKADRKQTRRGELAQSHCIVAIAGGSRDDFDELYEYLLEPRAAFVLEQMINNGWFLTPNALTQN